MANKVKEEITIETNIKKVTKEVADLVGAMKGLQKSFDSASKNISSGFSGLEKSLESIAKKSTNAKNSINSFFSNIKSDSKLAREEMEDLGRSMSKIRSFGSYESIKKRYNSSNIIYRATQEAANKMGKFKPSEKEINASVDNDPEVIKAGNLLDRAKFNKLAYNQDPKKRGVGAANFNKAQTAYNAAREKATKKATENAIKNSAEGKAFASLKAASIGVTAVDTGMQLIREGWNKFNGVLKQTLGISFQLKDVFYGIAQNMANVLNKSSGMATYDYGTSLVTNSQARTTAMQYGLSASQTYAFTNAKSMLGINSIDDLVYMNENQQKLFATYMQKYSAWYDQLNSSGVLQDIQEMQLEFAMMKQEISMNFLTWMSENKDTIMNVLNGTMKVLTGILNFLSGSWFRKSATTSDTTSSTSNSTSNTISINMNNNATGVLSSQQNMENFFKEQIENLAKQTTNALGG